jgi:hypothetical protein
VSVEASIEYEKLVANESTTILNNPTSAKKKKKSIELVGDTLSTRKSVRLSVKMKK